VRDLLKAGLSASVNESSEESGPSVSELAEKIKALKAANSIEAMPQRARQKHSSAEEPITARIRRRAESMSATESTEEIDPHLPPESPNNPSSIPSMTFQERIATERQRNPTKPNLS